ncbi:MAG: hypothetical protein M5U08_05600 [Burkholderiales bacterium]|nr:hypothetical protein [Burkholderiales bacterium]
MASTPVPRGLDKSAHDDLGFDDPERELQPPVAAERIGAGEVGARRDVRAGERRDPREERLAVRGGGEIAAVEDQVAAGLERRAPAGHRRFAVREHGRIKQRCTQLQLAIRAVAYEVHGVELHAPREDLAHLRDAVALRIQDDDLDVPPAVVLRLDLRNQVRMVGDGRVDEDELEAAGYDRRCCGQRVRDGLVDGRLGKRQLPRDGRRHVGRQQEAGLELFEPEPARLGESIHGFSSLRRYVAIKASARASCAPPGRPRRGCSAAMRCAAARYGSSAPAGGTAQMRRRARRSVSGSRSTPTGAAYRFVLMKDSLSHATAGIRIPSRPRRRALRRRAQCTIGDRCAAQPPCGRDAGCRGSVSAAPAGTTARCLARSRRARA